MLNNSQVESLTIVIRKASDIVLGFYQHDNLRIQQKADLSPVTEADLASNRFITQYLESEFPGIPVISEENPKPSWEERLHWDLCWMLDPLDGTKEFIARNDEFAINLALIKKGKPIFGLISIPAKRRIYTGIQGGGSWLSVEGGKPVRLPCSVPSSKTNERIVLISRSHSGQSEENYLNSLRENGFFPFTRPTGSSYKHVLLAEGTAHLYPKFGSCWEWDTAPGQLILEEAGGCVTRIEDGLPLLYNKESFLNPDFIMWAPGLNPVLQQTPPDIETSRLRHLLG